ncbi:hypothetical protein J6590_039315 [Homalodisca vitripennis]|nr:hypothetical protein J6590_039315 [Homalodisca vitripennis]
MSVPISSTDATKSYTTEAKEVDDEDSKSNLFASFRHKRHLDYKRDLSDLPSSHPVCTIVGLPTVAAIKLLPKLNSKITGMYVSNQTLPSVMLVHKRSNHLYRKYDAAISRSVAYPVLQRSSSSRAPDGDDRAGTLEPFPIAPIVPFDSPWLAMKRATAWSSPPPPPTTADVIMYSSDTLSQRISTHCERSTLSSSDVRIALGLYFTTGSKMAVKKDHGSMVTAEPPPTAGQAGCFQGQDRSAVTHPSSSHARRCLIRLSRDNRSTHYTAIRCVGFVRTTFRSLIQR